MRHWPIYSFNKLLLNVGCTLDTAVGAGDKTKHVLPSIGPSAAAKSKIRIKIQERRLVREMAALMTKRLKYITGKRSYVC